MLERARHRTASPPQIDWSQKFFDPIPVQGGKPLESHAGDPDDRRRTRRLDARTVGRSEGAATTAA